MQSLQFLFAYFVSFNEFFLKFELLTENILATKSIENRYQDRLTGLKWLNNIFFLFESVDIFSAVRN